MSEGWKEKAADIGKIINRHAKAHPELEGLATAWGNFAKKHGIGVGVRHDSAKKGGEMTPIELAQQITETLKDANAAEQIQAVEIAMRLLFPYNHVKLALEPV